MKKMLVITLLLIAFFGFSLFAEEEQNEYAKSDVTMATSFNDFANISAEVDASAGYYWFVSAVHYVYKWNSGTSSWQTLIQDTYHDDWPYDGNWHQWQIVDEEIAIEDIASNGNGTYRYEFEVVVNSASADDHVDFTVIDVISPSTPTSISGYISAQNHPRVTWSDGNENDLNGFKIYRADGNEAPLDWYYLTSVSGTANGYTDESITHSPSGMGPNYVHYKVTSYDHNSNESSYSSSVQIQYNIPFGSGKKGFATQSMSLVPTNLELYDNYPNPFNPATTISFSLPETKPVKLNIYNVTGQMVNTLVNANLDAGSYQIEWNGTNANGTRVSSGIYLYELIAGDTRIVKKMFLAK